MYRFFARRVCLGLIAFGCGSPGDLDRERFPELDDTGYPDRVGAAGAGGGFGVGGAGVGGAGVGVGGAGVGGATSVGAGGMPGVSGAGGTQPGAGGQPVGQAGAGQVEPGPEPGGCPDDITVLLNRPGPMGGCAGGGCHVPGGTPPDLVSPGLEERVLNVVSPTCNNLPYVGSPMSVIEDKITNPRPVCGSPMPLLSANQLTAEDEACILDWIDGLVGGG